MKKITFVEKEEASTYDPVSTFFANTNKKPSSVAKSTNVPQQGRACGAMKPAGSVERPPSTKLSNEIIKKIQDKQKPVTSKIGRKGDHLPPRRQEQPAGKKQQSIYPIGASKKNIRANTSEVLEEYSEKQNSQKNLQSELKQQVIFPNVNQRRSPTKPPIEPSYNEQQTYRPPKQSTSQLQNLRKRIKELESSEQEYIRKIEQLEAKEQKYVKIEQKYNKLQKEHKQCGENKETGKKLKEKEDELRKLLAREEIPYNKKRQIMLSNQLATLKKINRQLVTRVKNYKGTDLVEVAIAQNKTDVLFKDYDHSLMVSEDGTTAQNLAGGDNIDMAKLESLAYRIAQLMDSYMTAKTTVRQGKQLSWAEEKKILVQLNNTYKQFSLECLGLGWKMPQSNKQCISLYNEIEKYRCCIQPMLNKHDLNFIITEDNIELINKRSQQSSCTLEFKQALVSNWQEPGKKFKKIAEAAAYYLQKYQSQVAVYEKSHSITNVMLAHCLAQISYIQAWLTRATGNLKESLATLGIRLKELEELCSLGEAGKEAVFLYLHTNIKDFSIRVPELQLQIKEIGSIFRDVKQSGRMQK